MLIDFSALLNKAHGAAQLVPILAALDEPVRLLIRRLDADLEAEDAGRRLLVQELQHLRRIMSAVISNWNTQPS